MTAVATLNASSVGVGIVVVGGVAMSFAATRENSVGVVREFYIYERVYGRAISKAVRGGSMKPRFNFEFQWSEDHFCQIAISLRLELRAPNT